MKAIATLTAASILAMAGAAAVAQTTPPAPPAPGTSAPPAAAPAPAPDQAQPRPERRPGLSRADMDALLDARIAAITAGLKLNADQQRLFAPVEQAIRAQAAERATRMEERRARRDDRQGDRRTGDQTQQQQSPDLMQRLERQAERVKDRSERLQGYLSALKPFWASLSDDQKRLLPVLMRQDGGGRGWRRGGRDHHDHHGRGGRMHRDHDGRGGPHRL